MIIKRLVLIFLILTKIFINLAHCFEKENRTALVIGNSNYKIAPLKNPINDANTISRLLENAGFKVNTVFDANKRILIESIENFASNIKNADVAFFYFSGHGIQFSGDNWLIPINSNILKDSDIEFEAFNSNRLLARLDDDNSNRVNIIILDACRITPIKSATRSFTTGLIQPRIQPQGSIMAFATAPGTIAYDGIGNNSPYVAELKKHFLTPGLKIEDLFKRIRIGVRKATLAYDSPQIPWENSSLIGDFYFIPKQSNLLNQNQQSFKEKENKLYWENKH